MKKADIIINNSNSITIIEKMDFDCVDAVSDALHFAFYPNGIKDDEDIDNRLIAFFSIFLSSVGWSEEEYWEEVNTRPRRCTNCGEYHNDEADSFLEDKNKPDPQSN